jgi:hypothetical protein
MKQRQRRSRIGITGLDRAIAFCFQYLNGDHQRKSVFILKLIQVDCRCNNILKILIGDNLYVLKWIQYQ